MNFWQITKTPLRSDKLFVSINLSSISMCSLFSHSQSSEANSKLGECLTWFGPFNSQEIRLWAVTCIYVAACCFSLMQPFSDELETGVKSPCATGGLTHCQARSEQPRPIPAGLHACRGHRGGATHGCGFSGSLRSSLIEAVSRSLSKH